MIQGPSDELNKQKRGESMPKDYKNKKAKKVAAALFNLAGTLLN